MRDTERQRYRHREVEAPCGEPDVGLDSPGPRDHDLSQSTCSTTEAPRGLADSFPLLVMGLFTFSISLYFSFARLHISGDLSISSMSPSLLAYNYLVFPYNCLIFFGVYLFVCLFNFLLVFNLLTYRITPFWCLFDLSSLICDFIYLVHFSFLTVKAG